MSLRGVVSHSVHNMGANVSLHTIIKKFTITYESVKCFDLLMKGFYKVDQELEESIPSFANRIEEILYRFRENLPKQISYHEQRLLREQKRCKRQCEILSCRPKNRLYELSGRMQKGRG